VIHFASLLVYQENFFFFDLTTEEISGFWNSYLLWLPRWFWGECIKNATC